MSNGEGGETRRRRRLDAATRRVEIANAAARVIIERGMHALRVQQVADEAGVSQPLVSQHFRSRDELIGAAFVLYDQLAYDAIVASIDAEAPGRERVERFLALSLRNDSEVTRSWTLWQQAWAYSSFSQELSRLIEERHAIWVGQCADLIRAGQEDGSIPAEIDAAKAGTVLMMVLDGAGVSFRYRLMDADQVLRVMADAITETLRGNMGGTI